MGGGVSGPIGVMSGAMPRASVGVATGARREAERARWRGRLTIVNLEAVALVKQFELREHDAHDCVGESGPQSESAVERVAIVADSVGDDSPRASEHEISGAAGAHLPRIILEHIVGARAEHDIHRTDRRERGDPPSWLRQRRH